MMFDEQECERHYWAAIERWNEARRMQASYSELDVAARSVAYWRDAWAKAVSRAERTSLSVARADIAWRIEHNRPD